jgi:hypothetical protein
LVRANHGASDEHDHHLLGDGHVLGSSYDCGDGENAIGVDDEGFDSSIVTPS